MEEKKDYRAELFYEPKNGYETMDAGQRSAMEASSTIRAPSASACATR